MDLTLFLVAIVGGVIGARIGGWLIDWWERRR